MCGIAGIAARNIEGPGAADLHAVVARMTNALAHRGPDAEGGWSGSRVVLGHRRLGIIDPEPASNQPFVSADGRYVLVYNGAVYNFRELRESLSQHVFRTKGDTEVLLAAWMEWGEDCLHRLEGMFAFAVWDVQQELLVIARDRFGVKPLYYHVEEGRLLFASELRSLLASGLVPRKLDEAALSDHLRHGAVHAPATIVQHVRMLLPGHVLRWTAQEMTQHRWWDVAASADPAAAHMDLEQVQREVRDRFFRSVEKRLVADVPFGAFLSGGIDSSAVVGAMAQTMRGRAHTFTVTFDEAEFSEARFAKLIAKKFGTKHTEIRLRPEDMLRLLPQALADMDHPSADGPNTWVVSKMTKEAGVTMALSGLGGDEVFGGYEVFKRSVALQRKRAILVVPRPLRMLIAMAVKSRKGGVAGWKAAELLKLRDWKVADTYPLARLAFSRSELRGLLAVPVEPDAVAADVRRWLGSGAGERLGPLSQVSVAEMVTYLPDVLLRDTDQMAMAHALEVRSPFLDHALTAFVLGVPDELKYPHTPKKLLTDALADLLPKEVTHRPKMGFTLPWAYWMRDDLRSFCEVRLQALARRPQFKERGVNGLWQRFLEGDPAVTWSRAWMLVVLEEWMQANAME